MTKILSKEDVMNLLSIEDTIDILEKAFFDLATDKTDMPPRTPILSPVNNGLSLFMPAYLKGMGALGTKVVTVYKDNPKKFNLPNVMGTIILLDEKTGNPLAIMEGGFLTAMRTGGVAGLATNFLARKNSKVHTLFGSGGMAKAHAIAVDSVRKIEKLNIFSLDSKEKKEEFKKSLQEKISCEIEITEEPEMAVKNSDVVTFITSSQNPLIDGDWIQPGTHLNGIGSHSPAAREIDTKTVVKSVVVCDLIEACKPEAGDFLIPIEKGDWDWGLARGSLGEIITGKIPGRETDDEITLFKSVGLAIQDISTAFHVYNKAVELKKGTDFNFR
jgi:ornithine cyclodeaminase/alanine dehydrogenase-like protein (mu-crystallin family)